MILVTGGFGYLGGRISKALLQSGEEVRIGTTKKNISIPEELTGCEVVHTDLLELKSLTRACENISTIIHLAAMNAQACSQDPEQALLVNGLGTLNLLKAAEIQGVARFIYFSTAHVYGSPLQGKITEKNLPRPIHPYSITHKLAEDYVLEANDMKRIAGTVFRLSNVVGTPITENTNCWMLVVNDLCQQAVVNKKIKITSAKGIERDYIPITEVCTNILSVITDKEMNERTKGEIYNLSSGTSISLKSLALFIAERSQFVLGYKPTIEFTNNTNVTNTLLISNKKALNSGFQIDSNIEFEIDNLLLNCEKWFGAKK